MIDEKPISKATIGDREYTVSKQACQDGATTYSFVDNNGDSQMKIYNLSPGIKLTHHSVHTDRSYLGAAKKGNVIEIHHCREGRMECSYEDGYLYLMPGDLAIGIAERDTKEYVFPLRHYHGITITINTDIAPKCFSCFLKDVNVQPLKVAHKLCEESAWFIIRSKDYIEHLFSEMYSVPCGNAKGYYKIKVLELLLVLSGIDPNENRLNTYTLSGSQVELAKRAASYIADNMDSSISVALLSQKFHVSATHLQNAFKGVFGVPVFSYIRIHKMNAAALQLVRTDKTVMEIANECGYDNASKFASAFREIMNETPLDYRKLHRLISAE
ncbi:MAG: helix-turn-helix transcriptional regulator [Ruminococcaceae bacterium]|nr:helix-turn-helix transcriptional regulator [Oscillospiraceae bacterium]